MSGGWVIGLHSGFGLGMQANPENWGATAGDSAAGEQAGKGGKGGNGADRWNCGWYWALIEPRPRAGGYIIMIIMIYIRLKRRLSVTVTGS